MSVQTITAAIHGGVRSPASDARGINLASRFAAIRDSLELTKRAKLAGSLLLTAVAALLGYGYLGPTLSNLISSTAFVLLAGISSPFFRGGPK